MNGAETVEQLRARPRPARQHLVPAARTEARADRSGNSSTGEPLAVVHAESVTDVKETMRITHATRTPVVTRSAGTELAGSANAGPAKSRSRRCG